MKKLTALLSFLILFTAFTCEDEPLDDALVLGASLSSSELIGEWQLLNFDIETTTVSDIAGVNVETNITVESTDVDYNLVFSGTDFNTSGSYAYDSTVTVNDDTSISDSYLLENISGSGTYSVSGNQITVNGQFFEFSLDGVDDSVLNDDEQIATFQFSDDGNTLTFTQSSSESNNTGGFQVNIITNSTSIWARVE